MKTTWQGVFPALTTPFKSDLALDPKALASQIDVMIHSGVHGLIVLGSLGENGVLNAREKHDVMKLAVEKVGCRLPVLACVAETTTAEACRFAERAAALGINGLMVLPAMQYVSDRRETMQHLRTVSGTTDLPIMIYNNPVSYGIDVSPEMLAELADDPHFVAVKESSADVRRVTDIRNLCGSRYRQFCGVDDLALESLLLGADGWVAGLVCAFPRETVILYELARCGRLEEARALYRWFMPLLRLDTSTKLVQNIKLAEAMTGLGTEQVRPPRLPLVGAERERVKRIIGEALASRPVEPEIKAFGECVSP